MRTTLTLDDDVAVELRRLREKRGEAFKDTVNRALRAGLTVLSGGGKPRRARYRTEPVSLGTPRLKNLDDIAAVLAFAEGEDHP